MKNFFFIMAAFLLIVACNSSRGPAPQDDSSVQMTNVKINITGMSCTGCEETITAGVTSLEGVQDATADYTKGTALVSYDSSKVDYEKLSEAIELKGYLVTGFEIVPIDSVLVHLN